MRRAGFDADACALRVRSVIRLPLGNALLLGVGGSGRQSLTRLAAFMEEYEVVQIEISKGCGGAGGGCGKGLRPRQPLPHAGRNLAAVKEAQGLRLRCARCASPLAPQLRRQ